MRFVLPMCFSIVNVGMLLCGSLRLFVVVIVVGHVVVTVGVVLVVVALFVGGVSIIDTALGFSFKFETVSAPLPRWFTLTTLGLQYCNMVAKSSLAIHN